MKQLIVIGLVSLAAIYVLVVRTGEKTRAREVRQVLESKQQHYEVVIDVLYSSEKSAWIREAANQFALERPNIQIRLEQPMGSFAGADAILQGERRPDVWMPADSGAALYLLKRWPELRQSEPPFPPPDQQPLFSLVRSPLVLFTWPGRLAVLDRAGAFIEANYKNALHWLCSAVGARQTWMELLDQVKAFELSQPPEPGTPAARTDIDTLAKELDVADWGQIKLHHTNPMQSNSGLFAIYLLAQSYFDYPGRGFAQQVTDDTEFRTWFTHCQQRIPEFPVSTQHLTNDVDRAGAGVYDLVFTYEHTGLEVLKLAVDEPPRFYYAPYVLWTDHPAITLNWDLPMQGTVREHQDRLVRRSYAIQAWIDFLARRPALQRMAVRHGFRPVLPLVESEIKELPGSPFSRRGVRTSLDSDRFQLLEGPDADDIKALTDLWSESLEMGEPW